MIENLTKAAEIKKLIDAIQWHDHKELEYFNPDTNASGKLFWAKTFAKKDILQWMACAMNRHNDHAYKSIEQWCSKDLHPTTQDKKNHALKTGDNESYEMFCKYGWLTPPLNWKDQQKLFAAWTRYWDRHRFDGYYDYHANQDTPQPQPQQYSQLKELLRTLPGVLQFFSQHTHTPLEILELMTLGHRVMNSMAQPHQGKELKEWMHLKTYCSPKEMPATFSIINRQQLTSEVWNNILQQHPLGDAVLHLMARLHVVTSGYEWSPPAQSERTKTLVQELRNRYPHSATSIPILHRWKKWYTQEYDKDNATSYSHLYDRYAPKRDKYYDPRWTLPESVISDAYKQLQQQELLRGTMLGKEWSMTTPREYAQWMDNAIHHRANTMEPLEVGHLVEDQPHGLD